MIAFCSYNYAIDQLIQKHEDRVKSKLKVHKVQNMTWNLHIVATKRIKSIKKFINQLNFDKYVFYIMLLVHRYAI